MTRNRDGSSLRQPEQLAVAHQGPNPLDAPSPRPAPAPKVAAAPRQLQTRWLVAVAVLVLLGGAVLLYAIPLYSGHTTVVVMARDVKMGTALSAADLTTADVAVGPQVAVVHPQDGALLGKTALADLSAGALLSPRQVGDAPVLAAGQQLVPVRLKLGQRPQQGLNAGQQVLAVPAPADPSSPGGQALEPGAAGAGDRGVRRRPGPGHRGRGGRPASPGRRRRRAGAYRRHRCDDVGDASGSGPVTAIAVVAGKAAPGATTVANALTLAFPEPVLLVDADPAGGDVVPGLLPGRASTDTGLLSWLVATRHLTAIEATEQLPQHALSLPEAGDAWVLAGLQGPGQAGVLASGGWSRLATTVERCGPVLGRAVIVDIGRLSDVSGWPVVDVCDLVLLVVRPTARSVQGASAAIQLLRRRLGDLDHVRLVVCGGGPYTPDQVAAVARVRASRPGRPDPGRLSCRRVAGRRVCGHRVRADPHPVGCAPPASLADRAVAQISTSTATTDLTSSGFHGARTPSTSPGVGS